MEQDPEEAGRSVCRDAILEMALNKKERMFCMLPHCVLFLGLHFSFLIHDDLCAQYLNLPECGFFFSGFYFYWTGAAISDHQKVASCDLSLRILCIYILNQSVSKKSESYFKFS